jgi:two-component system, NarL family, response regulator LiaR
MIKVAIIENTVQWRLFWTDILNNEDGFICIGSFSNLTDALAQLPSLAADVVFMDIQLLITEMGRELISGLRAQDMDSQFLIFINDETNDAILAALKAGANGLILKDSSPKAVLTAITDLHAGGSPLSTHIARRVFDALRTEQRNPQYKLTFQEQKVMELLAKGLFYKEIAEEMDLKISTIKQYCHSIYKKLNVSNRTEAVNKYFQRPTNTPTTNKG